MQTQKRRRRIERIKTIIRALLFLKRYFEKGLIVVCCLMVLSLSFAGYFSIRNAKAAEDNISTALQMAETEPMNPSSVNESKEQYGSLQSGEHPDAEDIDLRDEAKETLTEIPEESEKYATSHKTEEPIPLSDIYAEEDSIVIFKCFYPDASGYTWEIYDAESQEWMIIPDNDIISQSDELQREISSFITFATAENDALIVRCTTDFFTKDAVTDNASLHVLKNITDISVDGDITVESGQYIGVSDIPVQVTYEDGSKETITGLNGIYFLDTQQSKEESTSVSGNLIETVTTINKAYEYTWADTEEKKVTIRYRNADEPIDTTFQLIGEDILAPVISQITVSDFKVSNIDAVIPVKVTIRAEDDNTAYDNLKYAFLPAGQEPGDVDWHDKASFDADITQNGVWAAYCKDEAGNIAVFEKDIIAVDNKAPYISVQLETEEETWCQKNSIVVTATDALPVEFFYSCVETGEESGWIEQSTKEVFQNGTWKIKVKDEAGNITETEVIINNIDTIPPIIKEIKEVKGKDVMVNEE